MSTRASEPRRKRLFPIEEREFEIESILEAGEMEDGTKKYKVKWKGYSDEECMWEEEESLPAAMVKKFWTDARRAAAASRAARVPPPLPDSKRREEIKKKKKQNVKIMFRYCYSRITYSAQ